MTKTKITLVALMTMFSFITVYGLDIVKKKKYKDGISEESFVLKENKNIKQGSALTTYNGILDKKYIVEFGQYDQNKKSGRWLFFYFVDPSNSLKTMGSYTNNLKNGDWMYYYPVNSSNKSINTLIGAEIRTNIVKTEKDIKAFQIEFDTLGQQLICTGKYIEDKKTGVWNYFSRSGYLLHSYAHDSNVFTKKHLIDPENNFLVYLGGPERFYNFFYMEQQETRTKSQIKMTSEVVYEIEKDGNYKLIIASGDANYKTQIEQILKAIPNEWINLNGETSKKLQLISKIEITENTFNRSKSKLSFKVVD